MPDSPLKLANGTALAAAEAGGATAPAPPAKAVRAARRRGYNAGLHWLFCGGRIAIGAGVEEGEGGGVRAAARARARARPSPRPSPSSSVHRPRLEVAARLGRPHWGAFGYGERGRGCGAERPRVRAAAPTLRPAARQPPFSR